MNKPNLIKLLDGRIRILKTGQPWIPYRLGTKLVRTEKDGRVDFYTSVRLMQKALKITKHIRFNERKCWEVNGYSLCQVTVKEALEELNDKTPQQ